jgi:tetratricopeptide (TPR) repeat protein
LNGRVSQRGDQLTLSLELVDARTGNQIWGEQYNRKIADLVSLQSEIARDVSTKLRVKLSGTDEQKLAKNYTENADAYQLYLKGQFYLQKRTVKDLQKAIECFQQATALEPNYALAFAGLADANTLISIYGGAPYRDAMAKAKEAALKALTLDDNLAEAHASLGQILDYYDYDFVGAEREYSRAIELKPNYATAHHWRGEVLSEQGRFEEAFGEYRRALEIDPLSLIINRMYGHSLLYARQYDAAVAQLKKTIELDATFPSTHFTLALAYEAKGNRAECVEEFAKLHELNGEPEKATLVSKNFAKGGWQSFLRTMTGDGRLANSSSYNAATFYVALGEKDKAFAELSKSYENREPSMRSLKVDPLLDPLRDDPRFAELMRRMGL